MVGVERREGVLETGWGRVGDGLGFGMGLVGGEVVVLEVRCLSWCSGFTGCVDGGGGRCSEIWWS